MEDVIRKIIKKIGKGTFFDSHYIINTLIKKHSDEYFEFIRNTQGTTRHVHSEIAKVIAKISRECDLVARAPNETSNSLSYTIHDKANECALWKRI